MHFLALPFRNQYPLKMQRARFKSSEGVVVARSRGSDGTGEAFGYDQTAGIIESAQCEECIQT